MAKRKEIDVKEVLRDLLAIARVHLRRKPICEIMEWDRGDVKWDMGSKKKWGTIPIALFGEDLISTIEEALEVPRRGLWPKKSQ